jgi:hypothetical protein
MKKESLITFAKYIVLMLGIFGGAYYLYLQDQKATLDEEIAEPQPVIGNAQAVNRAVEPAVRRTATPIKCTQADGSVFWTNASRCEDADLNNRLSFAEPVKPAPREKTKSSTYEITEKAWINTSQANSRVLKPIPRKMNNVCSFAIGKAQEIEKKSLRLKDDPAESLWKESYCRWVCEARAENCEDIEDYLGMTQLCPDKHYPDKSYCNN